MLTAEPTVFVVDDDAAVRDALKVLLTSVGMKSQAYSAADEFLEAYDHTQPGCLVLDIRMPGMDGLELQKRLNAQETPLPIIMVSGHGDIRMAVDTVKAEAVDFLEKPLREHTLLNRIRAAIKRDAESRRRKAERAAIESRLATLTARENEVLDLVIAGKSNKVIAVEFNISHKTVESHRTSIMRKMEAQTTADLVRMASII